MYITHKMAQTPHIGVGLSAYKCIIFITKYAIAIDIGSIPEHTALSKLYHHECVLGCQQPENGKMAMHFVLILSSQLLLLCHNYIVCILGQCSASISSILATRHH